MTAVGILREIKNHEYRVGMTPAGVKELVRHGHDVWIETQAGAGAGFPDEHYVQAGAHLCDHAAEVMQRATLLIKVKEPLAHERRHLEPRHTLFTYLHLAPDEAQTVDLIESGAVCIAYETVTDDRGHLPLLAPMSEVAGRLSVQAGAHALEKYKGGRGVLLSGVAGVKPGRVSVLGGGVVGRNAARLAMGLGAEVTVLDKSLEVLRELDALFAGRVHTLYSTGEALEETLLSSDLLIGAVLVPGAAAPKLITRDLLRKMPDGAAFVDVSIDQGGCAETSRPTTHDDPVYIEEGVVHYCVANMPGAVARTSTLALTNATLPYILALADEGTRAALKRQKGLRDGLNVARGMLTCKGVAQAQDRPYVASESTLDKI
ncbi:alanine dehydrogenase [Mangrovitalea sediminis]|uniref:alanine dehydrogenase n=1 Tax=Mangrovitalea sediminis TaxID=1982043 RepID=UPI000BE586A1|nr:alanine dehydrogenase [Mangrovitalea sediminis]